MNPCHVVRCWITITIASSDPGVAGNARRPVQVLLLLKQGVHRLHLSDPCSAVSVTKGSSVATLELSSLTARHAAVAVKPPTQRSDALDSGRPCG